MRGDDPGCFRGGSQFVPHDVKRRLCLGQVYVWSLLFFPVCTGTAFYSCLLQNWRFEFKQQSSVPTARKLLKYPIINKGGNQTLENLGNMVPRGLRGGPRCIPHHAEGQEFLWRLMTKVPVRQKWVRRIASAGTNPMTLCGIFICTPAQWRHLGEGSCPPPKKISLHPPLPAPPPLPEGMVWFERKICLYLNWKYILYFRKYIVSLFDFNFYIFFHFFVKKIYDTFSTEHFAGCKIKFCEAFLILS